MAIGDEEPRTIELVNWDDLYARNDGDEAIIPDLAFRGRWTAIAAPAKAGKSTVLLALAVSVAQAGLTVLYVDAEMGRADVLDRVDDWMQLKPSDLANMHYSDLPPKLDTVEGEAVFAATIEQVKPDLVVIDGLNGVVVGDENDNTTWRDFFEYAIAPLKERFVAVVTLDNSGHGDRKGPRGSSVKLDKPDAILVLERTDQGVKLTATHRRASAYPLEQHYAVSHASEEGPPMAVVAVRASDPDGATAVINLLDDLGAPVDIGVRAARRLVKDNGGKYRHTTIDAAVKLRRTSVPDPAGTLWKTPGQRVCPPGVSTKDTPPAGTHFEPDGKDTEVDPWEPFG